MGHIFQGKWITNGIFANLEPKNIYHKQLDAGVEVREELKNQHILFRRKFVLTQAFEQAKIYITADDYYKLYINGRFVNQGPTPAYPFHYNYNVIDVTPFLTQGINTIAVHTLYQGLINRVWVSGDEQHGLLLDLEVDGKIVAKSDESFLVKTHSGYKATGIAGYRTQFLEEYNSNAKEKDFFKQDFDDSDWENAKLRVHISYDLYEQPTKMLEFEEILPVKCTRKENKVVLDFGKIYVGYVYLVCQGNKGEEIIVRCGQELTDDGQVRYALRARCTYEEGWILSGAVDVLDWFDYKSFRYVEVTLPDGCQLIESKLVARHYPFELQTKIKDEYKENKQMQAIWELCVNSLKYGVQEVIQDCMEREKGFYVGDGCFTSLAHMILTNDDSICRYLIDSARLSSTFVESTVTCLNCSVMQEIAEYPLIMISLMWWHYQFTGDKNYLKNNYPFACQLLDIYRRDYEKDGLLQNIDKWCVVEWPKHYQDGYAVDTTEGQVCVEPHISINAYYLEAISVANKMAKELGQKEYRNRDLLEREFFVAFYDKERKVFKDGKNTNHSSYIANVFAYGFNLIFDDENEKAIAKLIQAKGLHSVNFFGGFALFQGACRRNKQDLIKDMLLEEGTWSRMLKEDATTTFEGWGKDCKINASLFHLTMSMAVIFMADIDVQKILA